MSQDLQCEVKAAHGTGIIIALCNMWREKPELKAREHNTERFLTRFNVTREDLNRDRDSEDGGGDGKGIAKGPDPLSVLARLAYDRNPLSAFCKSNSNGKENGKGKDDQGKGKEKGTGEDDKGKGKEKGKG